MAKPKIAHEDDEILRLLASIDQQLRTLVKLHLAPIYASTITTPELQRLYKATGTQPVTALAKSFSMSAGKISMLWQSWEQIGLLKKTGQQYECTL